MKDDKKKFIVLGALLAVMLGVGAFSFLGGGSPPPAPEAVKTDKEKEDAAKVAKVDADGNPIVGDEDQDPPKNPLYAMELPQRDPFAERPIDGERITPVDPSHETLPKPAPKANRPVGKRPSGPSYIPPVNPAIGGPLPPGWGDGGGTVSISPTGPDPSQFGYTVSGTMTGGSRKIAVFTDSNGNQRMVPEGGSLDGDSKVVAIDKGSVTIEHRGKKQRLSLGGNPK